MVAMISPCALSFGRSVLLPRTRSCNESSAAPDTPSATPGQPGRVNHLLDGSDTRRASALAPAPPAPRAAHPARSRHDDADQRHEQGGAIEAVAGGSRRSAANQHKVAGGGHQDGSHVGIVAQPAGVSGSGASSSTPAANQRHAVEPGARGALRAGLLSIAGS
jgi:hypothetical protein